MVGARNVAVSGTGVGLGVGTTALVRQQLDATNETSVFRPSVLWGVGTGLGGMALPMVMDDGGVVMELLEDYSSAALAAGVLSAVSPKGGGVQLPTL